MAFWYIQEPLECVNLEHEAKCLILLRLCISSWWLPPPWPA